MRILHTSDIHLVKVGDERWNALKKIIELAEQKAVDVLAVSGDLFDKSSNADLLRNETRKLFSKVKFKVILIPGNHDYRAFVPGVYFGKNVIYRNSMDAPVFSDGNVDFWSLPFESISEVETLKRLNRLSENADKDKLNILLFHGELLDAFYGDYDYGEEGGSRYMPVKLSYFEDLNFQYILAGHFHRNFDVKKGMRKDGNPFYFIYSGSPVSITKRELGRRSVNIFVAGKEPEELLIDTQYFELREIFLDPLSSVDPVLKIEKEINNTPKNARIILRVNGYINSKKVGYKERDFYKKIDKILNDCHSTIADAEINVNDISSIFEDELYNEFHSLLETRVLNEDDKNEIIDLVIKSYIRLR